MNEWRDVPGFDGMYQVSRFGEVRSYIIPGGFTGRLKNPKLLKPYLRRRSKGGGRWCVNLVKNGRHVEVSVMSLVVDCWLGGRRQGLVAYHKNGDKKDNCVNNIAFCTPSELGAMSGGQSGRKPVARVDENGNAIAFYKSAQDAADANYMSSKAVCDRCNGLIKNPGDYRFAWDV